jgi:hypothetical protein
MESSMEICLHALSWQGDGGGGGGGGGGGDFSAMHDIFPSMVLMHDICTPLVNTGFFPDVLHNEIKTSY